MVNDHPVYIGLKRNYKVLELSDDNSDLSKIVYYHVIKDIVDYRQLKNGNYISDCKTNRDLISFVIKLHNYNVIFVEGEEC